MDRPLVDTALFWISGLLLATLASGTKVSEVREYCEDEAFRAECAENEAVIIDVATYGRMRTGKCITTGMLLGCDVDVVTQLDRRCSGRSSCEVLVTSLLHEGSKPCPLDFRSYLEASYHCMPVVQASKEGCFGQRPVKISATSGQISSLVTRQSGCGSIDNPWLVEAGVGQRLNFTLYDFSLYSRGLSTDRAPAASENVCTVYAIIKESTGSETICGGRVRTSHVFTSKTPTVEVRLVGNRKQTLNDAQFILKYEAIGCADPEAPPGGWVKRRGQKATAGCFGSRDEWTLSCSGQTWVGAASSCPYGSLSETDASRVLSRSGLPNSMSIVIVVGIALVVGLGILLIGLLCLKRQRLQAGRRHYATPDKLPVSTSGPYGVNKSDPNADYFVPNSENDYYKTWQLQQRSRGGSVAPPGECPDHGLGPPPQTTYRALSTDSSFSAQTNARYSEHLYESPKFDHRDAPYPDTDGAGHAKYFELDPEGDARNGPSRDPGVGHPTQKADAGSVKIV